eukprot:1239244-Rhodomonas_salina.1
MVWDRAAVPCQVTAFSFLCLSSFYLITTHTCLLFCTQLPYWLLAMRLSTTDSEAAVLVGEDSTGSHPRW